MHTIRSYRLLKILEDGISVKKMLGGEELILRKVNIPANAKAGDILQWCEYNFYDIVDEDGNFLSHSGQVEG